VRDNLWLHRFATLVAVCTLLLIFIGGLVTSTGSGLAVPDWPLSYGQVFPEMVGGVAYEHGHRMAAAVVGLLTVVLALWLWKQEPRRWVRMLGFWALVTVVSQGILGGITVLFLLPTAVSISHAALAQIFLCLTVCIAVFTSPRWQGNESRLSGSGPRSVRSLAGVITGVVYLQILVGALVRHTGSGLAIPDFPLSYGRLVPPFFTSQILLHFTHRVGALVIVVIVVWLALRVFKLRPPQEKLRRGVIFLMLVVAAQILLGGATIWSSRATILTTLHVAGGALTLVSILYLTLHVHRILQPNPDPGRSMSSWFMRNQSAGKRLRREETPGILPGVDA
jgi:cytochrome c oxidase assembly protein subunit 15